jgi:beta-glucosidase
MNSIKTFVTSLCILSAGTICAQKTTYPFQNPKLPIEQRVSDLISRMTLEEKVAQMMYTTPPITRLGIPAYNWWNEALHGVARTKEKVTVFPQAIGVAATFDPSLACVMGTVASTEGRAIFNQDKKNGKEALRYHGLTYWTPNINIFRDPRWGRGQETYGEDPYLTGQFGLNMVKGLQGTDSRYMRAAACAKHFAAHSGPEFDRLSFDSKVSLHDLFDTYLASFRQLVMEGNVAGVMCAYNSLNGEPCCGNNQLMMETLRLDWGFKGYVTSDCWALDAFIYNHKTQKDSLSTAVSAVLNNTDLECGGSEYTDAAGYKQGIYRKLYDAVKMGEVSEKRINESVARLMTVRFRLGLFDSDEMVPYAQIPYSVLDCNEHRAKALEIAQKSIVLLKNDKKLLPLQPNKIKSILVIGPNANNEKALWANYNGYPSTTSTPYKGIAEKFGNRCKVDYLKGCDYYTADASSPSLKEVAKKASQYSLIVFVGGINADLEGENGSVDEKSVAAKHFKGGDKTSLEYPAFQSELFALLKKTGKPIVFVNVSGSALAFNNEAKTANAVIQFFYGGQATGKALADVLAGDYNPAGRLPLTFYASDSDLPALENYSMDNRTYRYFKGHPLYPFGYGLSYTTFRYSNLQLPDSATTTDKVPVTVTVKNIGQKDGDEVVQLYVKHPATEGAPIVALKGVKRINLKAGESKEISFELTPTDLGLVNNCGSLVNQTDNVKIYVGGGQPQYPTLTSGNAVERDIAIKGDPFYIH